MPHTQRLACTDLYWIRKWEEVVELSKGRALLLLSCSSSVEEVLPEIVVRAEDNGLSFGIINSRDVKNYMIEQGIWFKNGCWIVEKGEIVESEKIEFGLLDPLDIVFSRAVTSFVDKYSGMSLTPRRNVYRNAGLPREKLRSLIRSYKHNSWFKWRKFYKLVDDCCASKDASNVEILIDALLLIHHYTFNSENKSRDDSTSDSPWSYNDQISNALFRMTGRRKGWFTSGSARAWLEWWQEHKKDVHIHEWERYRCKTCGATRPEEVTIPTVDPALSAILEHKYLADNPCLCGGSWKMETHSSPIPNGISDMHCQCSTCGAKQIFIFHLKEN